MKRQRGATMWTWLVVIAAVGFAGLMAAKIVPVYLNHYSVKSALEGVAEDAGATRAEAMDRFFKRLQINNVNSIKRNQVSFNELNSGLEMRVEYEVRTHLFGNFDGVAKFDEQVVIPR